MTIEFDLVYISENLKSSQSYFDLKIRSEN